MTNMSYYLELQYKKTLFMGSYFDIADFLTRSSPFGGVNVVWVVAVVCSAWLLTLATLELSNYFFPLRKRRPSKAFFFAAFQEKIRKTFRCQNEDSFKTIMMGTNRILGRNVEDPTVFLVLAPRGTMSTAVHLVTLMVHCTLVACQIPSSHHHVRRLLTDGRNYSSHDDEWPLFYKLKKHLRSHGVAALFAFESLHPQTVRTLQHLVPLVFAPYPESVVILVADLRNRFTEHQKQSLSANSLGQIFLQELLGPYFDRQELQDTIGLIGSRCILVNAENLSPDHIVSI